jgi:hypothetical protein
LAILVVTGVWQMRHLKKFFEAKNNYKIASKKAGYLFEITHILL